MTKTENESVHLSSHTDCDEASESFETFPTSRG